MRRSIQVAGRHTQRSVDAEAGSAETPLTGPDERNRYADLLRVGAIGAVVIGHWLLTDVENRAGRLVGRNALNYVPWGGWVTLLFQVMPVFFLVGGYANAVSWQAHRRRGASWADWVRGRVRRLLWPATSYVVVAVITVVAALAAGANRAETGRAAWFTALHLWFLPVYLILIAATPAMLGAHRRWGLVVPAAMAVGAGVVDALVLGPRLPVVGFANYVLVWGAMHQCGFAWQDGTLTRPRRPWALAGGGTAVLAVLLVVGPFPVDMIGAGERFPNTSPPSVALLAYAAAQTGLVLAAEPAGTRFLRNAARWRRVARLNAHVLTVYLWHMAPVVIIAVTLYRAGVVPQPAIGTAQWWALRLAWFALLGAVLVPLVGAVQWAQRPLRRLPAVHDWPVRLAPVLLATGMIAASVALIRLAIGGFAPDGHPPWAVLAAYGCGVAVLLW